MVPFSTLKVSGLLPTFQPSSDSPLNSWTHSPACSADAEWPACSPAVPLSPPAFSFCAPGVQEERKREVAQIVPVFLIIVSFYSGNTLIMCFEVVNCRYNPFEFQLLLIKPLVPLSC